MRIPIALAEPGSPTRDVLVEAEPTTEVDDVAPALLALAVRPPPHPALYLGDRSLAPAYRLLASGVVAGSVLGLGGPGPVAEAPPELGTLELAVVGGRTAGGSTVLRIGSLTLGRSPECDIVLEDTQASRLHARLTLAPDGGMTIEDLDSSNGTTVNGVDLHGVAPLLVRDLIVIGSSALVVRPRTTNRAGLEATGDGRLRYNKPPRALPAGGQPAIAVPEEPRKPSGAHLPLGSILAPLVLAPVLFLATGNPSLMLIVVVSPLMAGMNALFDSRSGRRTYKKRLAEYQEESAAIGQRITEALRHEERVRRDLSADPALVRTIATLPTGELWERRPDDPDHLHVRVGLADQRGQVVVAGSAEGLPPLVARSVPVTVPLQGRAVVGVAGGRADVLALARSMVLQAATLQSPNDLAIVVVADDGDAADWDWAKWLPHTVPHNHEPCQRLLGLNARQRSRRLGELAATIQRREASSSLGSIGGADRDWPTTVVVFDRISRLRADEAVAYVLSAGPTYGIVSLCLDDDPAGLPAESTVTVRFGTAASGDTVLSVAGAEIEAVAGVIPDGVSPAHATVVARALAPLFEVAGRRQATGVLPQPPVDHLDVLGLSPLTIDGVRQRWASQPRGPRALAPIGLDTAGAFEVDLVRDGPHALIAGTTGAGKSELLQVIVASLAATKGPDRLTFLLVDFKGGSAFKDCEQLPHTVGVISNLDGRLVARALDAIQAELRWRETRFGEVGAKDFDEYESSSRSTVPIPRLVIVVDELKELADAYADAIPRLNQTARLGRGLGVHLVLATQKPASIHGLADLRANTDLRICLRVQDETDSRDLLGVADAAHISRTTPGRGFARLSDGRLVAFQSGYLGDPAEGGPTIDRARNPVRSFAIGGVGDPVAADPDAGDGGRDPSSADVPSQLQALVGAIAEAARQLELPVPRRPWLPPLPSIVSMDDPRFAVPLPVGTFPIGIMDLPHQQLQQPLLLDFDQLAHVLVVGGTRSGRTSTLRTLAGMVAWRATPVDVHLYVVECRRRTMDDLERLPHCGAVVGIDDRDRLDRLFAHLSAEIDRRSTIMGAAGSLHEQRAQAAPGQALPHVLVLVDNYEAFYERFSYEDGGRFVEQFDMLVREGPARGIHFVITTDQRASFNRLSSVIDAQLVLRPTDQDAQLSLGLPSTTDLGDLPPGRGFWAAGPIETQVSLLSPNPAGEAQVAALLALADQAARGIGADDPRLPTHVNAMPVSLTVAQAAQRRRLPRPGGAVTSFAVGGVAVEPIDVDLRAAGYTFVVAGPRGSGRSTALLSLTRSLITDGTERISAIVVTPRRSPLRTLEGTPGVTVLSDPATLTAELTEALAWMTGTVALVIDDAEQLLENPVTMKFDQLVRSASDDDRLVVLGGTTADLMRRFSGWIFDARQSKSGLILQPGAPADGEVLDLRLARGTVGGDLPPGRGILTVRGRWLTAQVALPDA